MKILLMLPPVDVYGAFKSVAPSRPPLGIAYMAAVLEKRRSDDIRIFDGGLFNKNDLENEIKKFRPDVVGISVTSLTFRDSLESAKLIREIKDDTTIVVGGPHISLQPIQSMQYDEFDIGVIGEGEYTFTDVVNSLDSENNDWEKINGVAYKDNGNIKQTEHRLPIHDLDELPFPARHLLPDLNLYKQTPFKSSRIPQTSMVTSRGCPYSCIFCSDYPFKKKYRTHSSDYVIAEIKHLIEKYGIREVAFQDDVFTLNKKRVHEICDKILEEKIDITWSCWARVNIVNKELLEKMKRAGCIAISYGVEASDDETLKYISKGVTIRQIKDAVDATSKAGIYNIGHFVIGYPIDNIKTINERINFAKSLPLDGATFTPLIPFPGSPVYEIAENTYGEYEKNYIYEGGYGSHTKPIYSPPGLTIEDMEKLRSKAYRSFYLRPSFVLRRLLKIKSLTELKNLINAGISVVREV